MQDVALFQTKTGDWVTGGDLLRALEAAGAHRTECLFVHTQLCFGAPNPQLSRQALLENLLAVLQGLGVPTIFVPTFTFSFCNGVDFDVSNSRSKMGALNEFIRMQPGAVRSRDPLMSVAGIGTELHLLENPGRHSIGTDSVFDRLHRRGGTRFLFLGASPSDCMTYVHYVEERLQVPYRYDREFTGKITDARGTAEERFMLFVRYAGVIPTTRGEYEQWLLARGLMVRVPCGDGFISAIDEPAVYETLSAILAKDINYLLEVPFAAENPDRHFEARNMVAL